jgi:hypothetical protein
MEHSNVPAKTVSKAEDSSIKIKGGTTMSQEKLKILEMLEEGKIKIDEAMALLKQVEDEGNRSNSSEYYEKLRPKCESYLDLVDSLHAAAMETARHFIGKL